MLLDGGGRGAVVPLVPGTGSAGVFVEVVAAATGVDSAPWGACAGGVCGKFSWLVEGSALAATSLDSRFVMLLTEVAAMEGSAALAATNLDSRFEIAAATEAVVVEVVAAGCCQRL